jgi:hypothetical protein
MIRNIGRQGEQLFSLLCAQAGVTCNPSQQDDNGWDHLIEFPAVAFARKAIDLQPVQKTAFVQIKTTGQGRPETRIKLSNALRMAKSPQPFFLVLVALDGNGGVPKIYAVHIWESLIARFLKRGRIADNKGALDTHKQQINLVLGDNDHHPDPIAWLSDQLGSIAGDYAGAKKAIVDRVGFENGYGTAQVQVELDAPDDFLDVMLGRKGSIKVTKYTFTSERFGIAARLPELDVEGGTLFITPNIRKGILRLTTISGETLVHPADVMNAAGPGFAKEDLRLRVVAGCIEIVWAGNGRISANANLRYDDRVPLASIAHFNSLKALRGHGPMAVTLLLDGKYLDMGSIEFEGGNAGATQDQLKAMVAAMQKVGAAAGRDDAEVSIADIEAAWRVLHLRNAMVEAPSMMLSKPDPDVPNNLGGMMSYIAAEVGGWVFGAITFRPVAVSAIVEGERRIYFAPPRILDARVEEQTSAAAVLAEIARKYEDALKRMDSTTEILALGEFESFVRATTESSAVGEIDRANHALES